MCGSSAAACADQPGSGRSEMRSSLGMKSAGCWWCFHQKPPGSVCCSLRADTEEELVVNKVLIAASKRERRAICLKTATAQATPGRRV